MKNRTLPVGYWWEPCKRCELPTIVQESASVNGGSLSYGCPSCILFVADKAGVRDAITEGMRALAAPSGGAER